MTEGLAVAAVDYRMLIDEVFLRPIRTVVAVDDEFPTFESLLEAGGENSRTRPKDAKRARDIIRFCHDPARRWLVDIHDGRWPNSPEAEQEVADHFHQSDLMILDYHLDDLDQTDGSEAISILRRLARNDHFNLVIVYTQGYENAGGQIERVVREIATGLNAPDERFTLEGKSLSTIEELLDQWEEHDSDIRETFEGEIDEGLYLRARAVVPERFEWSTVCAWPELERTKSLVDKAPFKPVKLKLIAKWAFHRRQQALLSRLASEPCGHVDFAWEADGTNWVRTDRLFVTVVSKTHEPATLPEKLSQALLHWKPAPHRLLMSKMRAELEQQGVLAERKVLSNPFLQTAWLEEFVTVDADERAWKIENTIRRHWEGLGDAFRAEVSDYARRLAECLLTASPDEVLRRYAPLNNPEAERKDIVRHHNRYACSKPVEGGYLTTGHVLKLEQETSGDAYWLCLSPACDLVPGQKTTGWYKRLGEHMPFTAVQLFSADPELASGEALGGNYVFLDIDGDIRTFSFTPPSPRSGDIANERNPSPKWEQMFAMRQGRFDDISKPMLSLVRVFGNGKEGLSMISTPALVVGQLRYEYALNLLQRLSASLSRVGVDFAAWEIGSKNGGQNNC